MSLDGGAEDRAKELIGALNSVQANQHGVSAVAHPIVMAAQCQGLNYAFGTISYAGRWATGEAAVTFDSAETGSHASTWPEWAYEIAKSALLANKRVLLTYQDEPFGNNLVFVSLTTL